MKTKNKPSCPYCGKNTLTFKIVPKYKATMKKVSFHVTNAKIAKCSSCKRIIVEAKELFRWEALRKIHLNTGQ